MYRIKIIPFILAIVPVVGTLLIGGCTILYNQGGEQTPQPKEVQITEDGLACGSGVGLNVGDTLILILNGNPSTGYTWDVGFYVHPVIEPAGEPEYQSDSNLVGAGGTYTFHFLATGEGEAKLAMIYHRPFDKDAPILKTCEVTVTVK